MADLTEVQQQYEAWWAGRNLPEHMKAAFWMVWQASYEAARSAISADAVPAQGVPSERDDAERLRFAMQDIDGFGDISMDKYDYAILEAEANGRDEPNADDELNGIRQLCDAAILATNSQTQEK